jgi:hypothetical protein
MSEQFFYAEFKLLPKRGVVTVSVSKAQEVVLEVPRKLIEDWKRENPEQKLTDQAIAADIARVVVVDAILSFSNLPVYELDVPSWLEERHPVMNARACDHHDNGIRAWVIKSSDDSQAIKAFEGAKQE